MGALGLLGYEHGCCASGAEEYGIIYDVVNVNREMLMGCAARMLRVRYSVAYPTGRERSVIKTSLPWGMTP